MTVSVKLYFDVCCTKRLPPDLLRDYGPAFPGLETRHLLDDYPTNADDPDWLRPLREHGWIVVTCDRGRDRRKPRLPMICSEWGITHVCLSSTLLRKGAAAQRSALDAVWNGIVTLHQLPPGTAAVLMELGVTKAGATRYALKIGGKVHASGEKPK